MMSSAPTTSVMVRCMPANDVPAESSDVADDRTATGPSPNCWQASVISAARSSGTGALATSSIRADDASPKASESSVSMEENRFMRSLRTSAWSMAAR